MRKRLAYGAAFLVLFLAASAIQWPAAWLAPWLDRASGGQWRLAATSGTLWHGAGMLLVRNTVSGAWRNAQSIGWQVRGGALWSGRLAVDLTLEQGGMRFSAAPAGFALESFDLNLPAGEIATLLPGALGRYGWSGLLHAQGQRFNCAWNGRDCRGEAELRWNDAAVSEIAGAALGDYQLRLVGEGPALRINLATLRGRLQLTGSGEVAAGGKVNFRGEATTADNQDESLARLLGTLGRPIGAGKYLLEYRESGAAG